MYCRKCGQLLTDDQEFCTNCGNKVTSKSVNQDEQVLSEESSNQEISNEEVIDNSGEQKNSINLEEVSTKVVSDVTEAVNNIVDKSKEVTQKLKNDEKVNKYVDTVKKNPNTLKVLGALVIALLVVGVGIFGFTRSTPEKTVKKFASAIESKDIKKALTYTNYETTINTLLKTESYFGVGNVSASKDKLLIEMQKEFREDCEGKIFKVNDVNELFREGNAAEVVLNISVIEDGEIDQQPVSLSLIKQKGKWVIDITNFDGFW